MSNIYCIVLQDSLFQAVTSIQMGLNAIKGKDAQGVS